MNMYVYIHTSNVWSVDIYCTSNKHCAFIGQAGETAIQLGEERLQSDQGSHKETRSAILSHLKEFIEEV